jgi:filamentous hemagglutinin
MSATSASTTARGGEVSAGGDVTIVAHGEAGEEGQRSGNVSILGSRVKANGDVTLAATHDITLQSAENTSEAHSKNSNKSGVIGVGIGVGGQGAGITVSASVAQGKGKSDQSSLTHSETEITAGNTLRLISGNDTTLKGALVKGERVLGDIGGNLNLLSEQDSQHYTSEQQQMGAGVSYTFGAGTVSGSFSSSKSNTDATYQSVVEQTGIRPRWMPRDPASRSPLGVPS